MQEPAEALTPAASGDYSIDDVTDCAQRIGQRIRNLKQAVRRCTLEYVDIGNELAQLKERLSRGANGQRSGAVYFGYGWQDTCSHYVGISYKTADRYIDDAEAYRVLSETTAPRAKEFLEMVEAGECRAYKALVAFEEYEKVEALREGPDPSTWAFHRKNLLLGFHTDRWDEMEKAALAGDEVAVACLQACARGEVDLPRAYAGWKGGEATRGKMRRDPDYARLILKSTVTARKGWRKYYDLDVEAQRVVTDAWLALIQDEQMPDELAAHTYRALKERFEGKNK